MSWSFPVRNNPIFGALGYLSGQVGQSARLMRTHSARSSTLGGTNLGVTNQHSSLLPQVAILLTSCAVDGFGAQQVQSPAPAPEISAPQDVVVGQQGFPRLTHDIVEETELKGDGNDSTAKNGARTEQGCFVSFRPALSKTWRPTGTIRRSIDAPPLPDTDFRLGN